MKNLYEARLKDLKDRMRVWGIDTALVTDDDNVFYLTGYYDYLHMEFGRPTIFIVSVDGPSVICLLYTSPSPRDVEESRMPSSA